MARKVTRCAIRKSSGGGYHGRLRVLGKDFCFNFNTKDKGEAEKKAEMITDKFKKEFPELFIMPLEDQIEKAFEGVKELLTGKKPKSSEDKPASGKGSRGPRGPYKKNKNQNQNDEPEKSKIKNLNYTKREKEFLKRCDGLFDKYSVEEMTSEERKDVEQLRLYLSKDFNITVSIEYIFVFWKWKSDLFNDKWLDFRIYDKTAMNETIEKFI